MQNLYGRAPAPCGTRPAPPPGIERILQRWSIIRSESWGDAPGRYESALLALNIYPASVIYSLVSASAHYSLAPPKRWAHSATCVSSILAKRTSGTLIDAPGASWDN